MLQVKHVNSSRHVLVGADDLLPLLVWVLVKGKVVDAEVEAEYMWGLLHPSLLTGEGGYYLTTLSSAVHVLKTFKSSQGTMSTLNVSKIKKYKPKNQKSSSSDSDVDNSRFFFFFFIIDVPGLRNTRLFFRAQNFGTRRTARLIEHANSSDTPEHEHT